MVDKDLTNPEEKMRGDASGGDVTPVMRDAASDFGSTKSFSFW